MQSHDPGHFFETNEAIANRERKAAKSNNKHGNPISMKSKILAAISDPAYRTHSIFVAESAGYARRVNLETSQTTTTYRGPKAPVTCLSVGGVDMQTLYAGSWDKDIWSWDIESGKQGRKLSGHGDFVKTVLCATVSGKPILISGGADKKIMVWDTETGKRLHTLQDPATTMLAVQHLAIDPVLSTADSLVLVSASSDPSLRRWKITLDACEQLTESYHDQPDKERPTILEHDTSIYKLQFDLADDEADLWTASADGSAKCLQRSRNFVADDTLTHGDYVRAVVTTEQWVITAGRDENVKVWDRATGKLYCTLFGHFEEITDLILLLNSGGVPDRICSVSIDGTIRVWPLAKTELDDQVRQIEETEKNPEEDEKVDGDGLMTAEEEAELAELMDSD